MSLNVPRALLFCSVISALSFTIGTARADDLCLPLAQGVPGMYGQAPDWGTSGGPFDKQINDPRWTGAVREDFPIVGTGMMPEVAFRGLYKGTNLYYSLQALVDDGVTTPVDAVYVGFATGGPAASSIRARILKITPQVSTSLSGDLTAGNRTLETWQWDGTSWTSTGLPDAWASATNAVGLWVVPGTVVNPPPIPDLARNTWAVNVTYDTSATSTLGVALGGGAVTRVWYQVLRAQAAFPSPTVVRHKWPYAADEFDETTALSNDVTKWGTLHLGITDPACPNGITIAPENIGTAPDISTSKPGDTVKWGTAAATNTFEAYPTYPAAIPPGAGKIKASFRIADWGSTIGDSNTSWKDVLPAPGTVDSDAAGKISWPCSSGTCPVLTSGTIPTGSGSVSDQCLLVQLFAGTSGGQPIHFIRDSARRNLSFVHLSKFERNARISVEGLAPLPGTTDRDVYIFIKTHNMVETTNTKTPPPDLQKILNPPPVNNDKRTNAAGQANGPPTYEFPFYDRVSFALPTYEVHVYHTTGRQSTIGGKVVKELEPQVPFGYFALHDTTPAGWKHSIEALNGVTLEEVGTDYYRVKVPNNGSVVVTTKIATCERYVLGLFRCCCTLARTKQGGSEGTLAALGVALLFAGRVRGRKRAS